MKERRNSPRIPCALAVEYRTISPAQHQALLPLYQGIPSKMRGASVSPPPQPMTAKPTALTTEQITVMLLAEITLKMDLLMKLAQREQGSDKAAHHTLPEQATCDDFSDYGLRINGSRKAISGEFLDLLLRLPGDQPNDIRVLARVVREVTPTGKTFEIPIVYTAIHAQDRERLARYAFHCQREIQATLHNQPPQ